MRVDQTVPGQTIAAWGAMAVIVLLGVSFRATPLIRYTLGAVALYWALVNVDRFAGPLDKLARGLGGAP